MGVVSTHHPLQVFWQDIEEFKMWNKNDQTIISLNVVFVSLLLHHPTPLELKNKLNKQFYVFIDYYEVQSRKINIFKP